MIGQERGFQRDELATHRILKWVIPIDDAQNMRSQTDGHWSLLDTLDDILNEGLTSLNALVVLIFREGVRQNLIQELEETGGALNVLGNLSYFLNLVAC